MRDSRHRAHALFLYLILKEFRMYFIFSAALISGLFWLSSRIFDSALWSITGIDVAWWWDLLGGLLPFNLPVAIVCWILRAAGVEVPFVELGQ